MKSNILAEKGEIFKSNDGRINKISSKAPSHDDNIVALPNGAKKAVKSTGGVILPDANSVLSDSYTQVKNGDRINSEMEQIVRISKREGNDLLASMGFGEVLKSSVSPSKLFEKAVEEREGQIKKLAKSENKLDKSKFSFNSKQANKALANSIPDENDIYEMIFNHQETKKQISDVDFEAESIAQFGGYNISKELDKEYDIPTQRSFLSTNLSKRFKQLGENMGTNDPEKIRKEYDRQIGNMYNTFVTDSSFDVSKRAGKYVYKDDKDFWKEQMNYEREVFNDAMLNSNTRKGTHYSGHNTILLNPIHKGEDGEGSSTALHELSHSLNAIPQHNKIKTFIPLKDKYYDDPDEVYSRRNQFIKANKINPNKQYTIDEIKKMRENEDVQDFEILNRYNDKQILKLLNDVAYNDKEGVLNKAQFGGTNNPLSKYL